MDENDFQEFKKEDNNLKIVLYTTGCPKCKILEKKLELKNIKYDIITDEEEIRNTGFLSLPLLSVDDKIMPFTEAVSWVNEVIV